MRLVLEPWRANRMNVFLRFPWNVAVGLVAVMAGVVLYTFDPSQNRFFPVCPSFALTGLYCPGCGTTRALHALLHGDFARAASMNVAVFVTLPLLALLMAVPRLRYHRGFSIAILICVVLYGVLRNVPIYPFSLLAPH